MEQEGNERSGEERKENTNGMASKTNTLKEGRVRNRIKLKKGRKQHGMKLTETKGNPHMNIRTQNTQTTSVKCVNLAIGFESVNNKGGHIVSPDNSKHRMNFNGSQHRSLHAKHLD